MDYKNTLNDKELEKVVGGQGDVDLLPAYLVDTIENLISKANDKKNSTEVALDRGLYRITANKLSEFLAGTANVDDLNWIVQNLFKLSDKSDSEYFRSEIGGVINYFILNTDYSI